MKTRGGGWGVVFQGGRVPPVRHPSSVWGFVPYEFWWREEIVGGESAESQFPETPVATTGPPT